MSAEMALWRAVMLNAIRDASGRGVKSQGGDHSRGLERQRARTWFRRGNSDFQMVCNLAGLDPGAVADAWEAGRLNWRQIYYERTDPPRI